MLMAGDELGRTQGGNNNAYCQDNADQLARLGAADAALLEFVAALVALRRASRLLRHDRWFDRRRARRGRRERRLAAPAGARCTVQDWHDDSRHAFALPVDRRRGRRGEARAAAAAVQPEPQPVRFVLPAGRWGGCSTARRRRRATVPLERP